MFQDRLLLLLQVAYFCHSLAKNTTEKKKDKKDMNTNDLLQAFELMGLGMAGVFIVLGILYIVAELLIKIFPVNN